MAKTSDVGTAEPAGDYHVRRYRPSDVEDVLDLDEVVWNRSRGPDWFRWKYERNPYVEEPPVFVAERQGKIVGVRPFMAFRIRAGRTETTQFALQPADTMVHPDHRRRGLFTRMTERALSTYREEAPGLYFNFPNAVSKPGYEKLGWRPVRPQVTYHRVERPEQFLGDSTAVRLLGRTAGTAFRGLVDFRSAISRNGSGGNLTVQSVAGVPVSSLAALYRRRPPRRLHTHRSEAFLSWRLGSPEWTRRTYVARSRGRYVAALVSRTRQIEGGAVVTQVADVAPLVGDQAWREAVSELLGTVLADHDRTDLFSVAADAVPDGLLSTYGFFPDDRLPLSRVSSYEKVLVTRPFDDSGVDPWRLGGMRVDQPGNWFDSFLERDTA